MKTRQIQHFRLLGLSTVLAVYFLILVGGAVRATGSGMGCPDWPTCFGQWIPPTSEQQLPANYQQIYADRGYAETRFNPTKTWIEYLNRLLGVTIGLLIFATMIASRHYRRADPIVMWVAIGAFLAVGFQGWLGSRVVASNLQPGMISLHMVVAQIIVAMLIYTLIRSQRREIDGRGIDNVPSIAGTAMLVVMAMTMLQMVMGTQVREAVDIIARSQDARSLWIERLPFIFLVHRSFSWLILFANAWLVWTLWTNLPRGHLLRRFSVGLLCLLLVTVVLGAAMNHLNMPAAAQPLHLWFASLIFGVQFSIYQLYRNARRSARDRDGLEPPVIEATAV